MQSLDYVVPSDTKIKYLNTLLNVGFDTVELGSIVSAKLIPQMADTLDVLEKLDYSSTRSNRMILVVNKKGAEMIAERDYITHISYPFSVSPSFLKMNLNTTLENSMATVREIVEICHKKNKEPVIYISMAFGNSYGDEWNIEILFKWINILYRMGVSTIPLSNVSIEINSAQISKIFAGLISLFPEIRFGLHLHTTNKDWYGSVNAAYEQGCRRFDAVIHGWGGCPMSGKKMLGNLKTENLLAYLDQNHIPIDIDRDALDRAYTLASFTFH